MRTTDTRPNLAAVLRDAVQQAMDTMGQAMGCKPLFWSARAIISGQADKVEDAGAWAAALGLRPEPSRDEDPVRGATPGTVGWSGQVDGHEVEVWCVTDRMAFLTAMGKARKERARW